MYNKGSVTFGRDTAFLFNRKDLVTLTRENFFLLNKKDAPQDAQLAERNLIATQYRSRAEIAQTRNLFYFTGVEGRELWRINFV